MTKRFDAIELPEYPRSNKKKKTVQKSFELLS